MSILRFGRAGKFEKVRPGKFIVIDGIDGSGKSTQVQLLRESLEFAGYKSEYIHFPQHGEKSAAFVDDYLAGKFGELNPRATSVFYALDRFEAAPKIRHWLEQGRIVIADRYVTANAAHQGSKIMHAGERVKFFRWLNNLEYSVFKIPKPNLNLILNVPAEASMQLIKMRSEQAEQDHVDVMHEVSFGHLKLSEQVYRETATLFPNTKLVECLDGNLLLTPQQIHAKVWDLVRRIALKDTKPQ